MGLILQLSRIAVICCSLAHFSRAQFPPPPQGVTTVHSKDKSGSSLSYKQTYICETTPGVKSYAGYVNLPSSVTGESFNISTFYWYFSARKNPSTAPLTIYLAGGAGETSLDGVNGEGGPCNINADSNSTTLNPWSWNNEVNVLYIDQPVQTGFSYDVLVNGTLDLFTGVVTPVDDTSGIVQNETTLLGTFPSQNPLATTLGSVRGAWALWHFMQVFVENFEPCEDVKEKTISLWGNSWAGFFIPPFFALMIRQNEAIAQKQISGRILPLGTMGTTNGCMDPVIEVPHYLEMATNNTYGFVAYNDSVLDFGLDELNKKGGCYDLSLQCRSIAAEGDPDYYGTNDTVNGICQDAFLECFINVQGLYKLSGRSVFDMSHPASDPLPNYRPSGYFNQAWVQAALGVPVNITEENSIVSDVYAATVGDAIRGNISNLEFVLSKGYSAIMVHGDRDYRCNWLGGEAISLAAQWKYTEEFNDAGYAGIVTNSTYDGGYVRQVGKFSFSRVFQAGHAVMLFQPETVYRIFQRAMSGLDIATGRQKIDAPPGQSCDLYKSVGPKTVRSATVLPTLLAMECYTWAMNDTCTEEQTAALAAGTAIVKDYVVISPGV